MKKVSFVPVGLALLLVFGIGLGNAQDKATKEECVAKCKEAAALIKDVGIEAALPKIQDAKGSFVWKDSYVFALDLDGKCLVHPITPNLVGKTLTGLKDASGKMFINEYIAVANTPGEGWVDYMWPKPGEKTPSPKVTYVYRVPGQSIMLCAGIYQ
ncbi:MAG: cache domain-containing protein [Syntrophobacteraceae bacterium]|jgi:signal transduction histidine kinase